MCVPDTTIVMQLIQLISTLVTSVHYEEAEEEKDEDEEQELKKEKSHSKNNKKSKGANIISLMFRSRSLWIYAVVLLQIMSKMVVQAVIPLPDGNGDNLGDERIGYLGGIVDQWIGEGAGKAVVLQKYGAIEDWDVSRVTTLAYLFLFKQSFTADLSKWDVSNVVTLDSTFNNAFSFNSDLSKW
jgi:hypothetical protein